jgi:hypothetical protein
MILYDGPSMLDGKPIVCIATAGSKNEKTGAMVQTWILPRDEDPAEAVKSGEDSTVCGDCPQRPSVGGKCYVSVMRAPLSVWKAYHRNRNQKAQRDVYRAILAGTPIRVGSYGDPCAVPLAVWQRLLHLSRRYGATSHTGYTHQWRNPLFQGFRWFLMASAENQASANLAQSMAWRTFAAIGAIEDKPAGSVECLSDAKGKSCIDCGICDGARYRSKQPASVWIQIHGFRVGKRRLLPVIRN